MGTLSGSAKLMHKINYPGNHIGIYSGYPCGQLEFVGDLKVSGGGPSELSHPRAEGMGILPHIGLLGHSGVPCMLAEPLEKALGKGTQVLEAAGWAGEQRKRVQAKRIWVGHRHRPLCLPVFISTLGFL